MSSLTPLERHPLSAVWGNMPQEQFKELVEDVRERGLLEPIVIYDGQILDGWHRYRACLEADVKPTIHRDGMRGGHENDPLKFVISRNLHRRHLTTSQRAMIAAKLMNLKHGGQRGDKKQGANLPPGSVSSAAAAGMLNVSQRSVKTARAVRDHAKPEIVEAVERGKMSVTAAARKAKSKTGSTSSKKPKTLPPASAAKLQARVERLEAELIAARMEIEEKAAKIDELEERIAFIQAESSPVAAVREEKFNNYRAHIRTLKGSVGQWQTKFQESNTENRFLRRRLRALGENIRP